MRDITRKAARWDLEENEEWMTWIEKIPSIELPEGCRITPLPPFNGALARFWVHKGDERISVYLDVTSSLGNFGDNFDEPYWEMYPGRDLEDIERFALDDVYGLSEAIEQTFEAMEG